MKSSGEVFFKDLLIGQVAQTTEKYYTFEYRGEAETSVSWTLPVQKLTYQSEELFPFFDGLIPEGWLLDIVSDNWKINPRDRMKLLLTICGDCIGAAHVKPNINQKPPKTFSIDDSSTLVKSKKCLICCERLLPSEQHSHAKCAKKLFGEASSPSIDVSLKDLDSFAKQMIQSHGALPGVQKKLSMKIQRVNQTPRLTVSGSDSRFILKPPTENYPEMPQIEHISMKLAELVGLKVAECGLIPMRSGELAYITKRFDRHAKGKIQLEDFCQLSLKPTEKKYTGSSESLGKIIDTFSGQPQDDKLTLFHLILFSFWIGNTDMHLKNFSLWKDPLSQSVRMAPGYDLLSTRLLISKKEDNEELALPVNGRKNRLTWNDFEAFAENLKIPAKVQKRIRSLILDSLKEAEGLIEKSFLSSAKQEAYIKLLRSNSERVG